MKILKYAGITLLVLMGLLVLLTGYAAVKNNVLSSKWRAELPDHGKLVDAGGTKLFISEKGTVSPTVIIEAGLGSTAAEWRGVQDALSRRARVVVYERAGYGHSGDAAGERTPETVVKELRHALDREGISAPYVLVGHDIGSLYTELFARQDPLAVMGMVLVDPVPRSPERFKKELDPAVNNNYIDRAPGLQMGRFFAMIGAVRSLKIVPYRIYPRDIREDLIEAYSQSRTYEAMISEYRKGYRQGVAALPEAGAFPKIPVIIIQSSPKKQHEDMMFWGVPVDQARKIESIREDAYAALMKLSPQTTRVIAAQSATNVHFEEPALLVRTVEELVQRFR